MARVLLPRLLLDAGLADIKTLGLATSIAAEADVALVHALCRWRLVSSSSLCSTLAAALRLPITAVDGVTDATLVAATTSSTLTRQLCARLRVLPLWSSGGVLGLGMTDPGDDGAVEQVVRACGLSVERLLVDDDALERGLRRAFVADDAPKLPKPTFNPFAAAPSTTMTPPTSTPDPFGEAVGAPPAVVTTVEPLPAFSPSLEASLDVVHGEPSAFQPFDESADFVDPIDDVTRPVEHLTELQRPPTAPVRREQAIDISVNDFAPIVSALVSQSQSQTATPTRIVDVPLQPPPGIPRRETPGPQTLPMRAPPGSTRHIAEPTRVADEGSSLDNDDTHDARPMPVRAVASDDRTIPDDSLLFLMRVLIVADGEVGMALSTKLRPRIKQLGVVPMHVAVTTMEQKRWDEVVVVDPPNTVVGSQVLATIAARAKNGAVLFTGIGDFARLPGVRAAHPLPSSTSAVCERVGELLLKRAHGE